MHQNLLIMKQVLPGTVGAIALTFCIVSYFAPVKTYASVNQPAHALLYDGDLKSIDTVTIDADFKVIRLSSPSTYRFHFTIQRAGSADLPSANTSSDFAVAGGFISAFDALRVAKLVIGKIRSGEAASINKADMQANKINY